MSRYSIVTLDEVPSTNGYAIENMPFLDNASVIYTNKQTSGRGRYNRKWLFDDNSENIFMTIVLKPSDLSSYPLPNLTQYLSVVLCNILERDFNLNPVIKWPNDILIDGAKISGILAETYMENNNIKGIALGLGLNVNMNAQTLGLIDQKAASLYCLKNEIFDCDTIVKNICSAFFVNYNDFVNYGFKYIKDEYIKRCFFLGKNIKISENGEKKEYFADSVDDKGFLSVKDNLNNEYKIITGDLLC